MGVLNMRPILKKKPLRCGFGASKTCWEINFFWARTNVEEHLQVCSPCEYSRSRFMAGIGVSKFQDETALLTQLREMSGADPQASHLQNCLI
jgi:hypothetical protein